MKMKKYFFTVVVGSMLFTSCKKVLDVNTDPDNANAGQATPQLVFPAAVASAAGRIGGDLAILGGIWAQHYTQNTTSSQYRAIDAFNLSKTDFGATTISSPWAELYSGGLNDLNFVIRKAEEQGNWNYFLMGTVIKAYTMQVLVDLYDQIPYSGAFQGSSNLTPEFDDGYTVYTGLLSEIDAALAKDFDASTNAPAGPLDFIFPEAATTWSIDPWIKFANTLKLKMYLRMVYAKPSEAQAGIEALYASGAEFLDEDAKMEIFEDAPDKSNPMYEYNFRKLNTDANLKASFTFLSWLELNADPRVDDYFQPKTGGTPTQFLAIHQGDYLNTDATFNAASKANIQPTDPVDFISLAESHFLQAEALERFFGGTGAKEHYDAGVSASFERYGDNPAPFIAPGGRYAYPAGGSFEEKLEAIIVQKWASLVGSHSLEAFFERNRTGYPSTSPVYSTNIAYEPGTFVYPKNGVTNGEFAKRLIFPDIERSKNPNTPPEQPVTAPVWWDVN